MKLIFLQCFCFPLRIERNKAVLRYFYWKLSKRVLTPKSTHIHLKAAVGISHTMIRRYNETSF